MSSNGKGLGRGINALFQGNPSSGDSADIANEGPFRLVSHDSLSPNPGQPRENFAEGTLQELADSIREKGVLQPLLVRPSTQPGTYQIIAGERRWRAARKAGVDQIPVIVRSFDDNDAMIAALIENVQRENLNPIELAKGLVALKDALEINQDALAERLGMQRSTISHAIRLLRLSQSAQDDLVSGKLTPGHGRAILGVTDNDAADLLHARIIENGLSVRQAEEAASFWRENGRFPWQKPEDGSANSKIFTDPGFKDLASKIGETLHCPAKIRGNPDKGSISLKYESSEQFYELLEKLGLSLDSVPEQKNG